MALIIETGEGLPNSNSYVSVAELEAYAADRLETLPVEGKESLLIRAMDYLEAIKNFKGSRISADQALAWPRSGVIVDGFLFDKTKIPSLLKRAQMQLGIEAMNYDLMPSTDGYAVASEKVDVIQVEYATGGRLSGTTAPAVPVFPKVDALLRPLLTDVGQRLRGERI